MAAADRFKAMFADPRWLYPDSDAGRAALIADLQQTTDAMLARLSDAFGHLPRAGVTIQRMPLAIVRALATVTDDRGVVHPGSGWTDVIGAIGSARRTISRAAASGEPGAPWVRMTIVRGA